MRAIFLTLSSFFLLAPANAQTDKVPPPHKFYSSNSGEWIFSVPILDVNGSDQGAIVRFSPFFNAQAMLNYDLSDHFGLFTGLSIRNQGFIYQVPDSSTRYKFRTYNLGIPVGVKLGRMHKNMVFLGYELELPFNYKEKRFENERKEDKFNVWFSDRTERFYQSVFVGFQGPKGSTLTVRYYLTNFHNKDFTETKEINGVSTKVKPYEGLNANLLTVSLGYSLFDGTKRKLDIKDGTPTERQAMR